MKEASAILSQELFVDVVREACVGGMDWSLVNEASGQILHIDPGKPSVGWVTVTVKEAV